MSDSDRLRPVIITEIEQFINYQSLNPRAREANSFEIRLNAVKNAFREFRLLFDKNSKFLKIHNLVNDYFNVNAVNIRLAV